MYISNYLCSFFNVEPPTAKRPTYALSFLNHPSYYFIFYYYLFYSLLR